MELLKEESHALLSALDELDRQVDILVYTGGFRDNEKLYHLVHEELERIQAKIVGTAVEGFGPSS